MYLYVYHIHKHLISNRDFEKNKFVKLEIKGFKAGILGKDNIRNIKLLPTSQFMKLSQL